MGKSKKTKKPPRILTYTPGSGINVRLRGKRIKGGKISLYLDYYQGYKKTGEKTPEGKDKISTYRKIEYLKTYLIDNPQTPQERQKNTENLDLAHGIKNNRESDISHNKEGFVAPYKKKNNFFDYCTHYETTYQKKDKRMITVAIKQFKAFIKDEFIAPPQIDKKKVTDFRDYLLKKYNGESPNSLFARFKKILNAATDEGYFSISPANKVTCKVPDGIPKEILSVDEVIKLSETDCPNDEIKRAFLFCLNTGLRYVDVNDLKYKHISNGQLRKSQQKTGREVVIYLNPTAIKLIGEMKKPDEAIFNLPTLTGCLKTLKTWAGKAGINRNITWHSARHSFATMLLINNSDIKTVQGLLGHSRIEHTQKYTHIVDELKKRAVNTLPEMNF